MADAEAHVFQAKDEVETADAGVPGVAEGTPCRVIGVSGLSWRRYRLRFADGMERNLVDGSHLRRRAGR